MSVMRSRSTRRTFGSIRIALRVRAGNTSTRLIPLCGSRTFRRGWSSRARTSAASTMQILAAKLAERNRQERRAELESLSGERAEAAWGNQIRSYVLAPYQIVKDVRTNLETGNVDAVLDGDLDRFMEAELRRRRSAATATA